jgi:Xaa-Pro aminopeptidase
MYQDTWGRNMNKLHWKHNRRALLASLPERAAAVLIAGNATVSRNADTPFAFRQDSNVLYLSGIERPGIALLADIASDKWYVILPKVSKVEKTFDDHQGWNDIAINAGLDGCMDITEAIALLNTKKQLGEVYTNNAPAIKNHGVYANPFRATWSVRLRRHGIIPKDVRPYIANLRMIKQPYEIKMIQQAIQHTHSAIAEISNSVNELSRMTELQVANKITAKLYANNLEHAYQPIVASGANAAVLHHQPDVSRIENNKGLLFDIGAEYYGYAADISRTIVIGGNASLERLIKDVQLVQAELIRNLRPGVAWKTLHSDAVSLLADLARKHELLSNTSINNLFPHAIGHFLGLDVHDVGDYSIPLQENMVITVEPGLYSQRLGMGVRIEDDILITKTGAKIL